MTWLGLRFDFATTTKFRWSDNTAVNYGGSTDTFASGPLPWDDGYPITTNIENSSFEHLNYQHCRAEVQCAYAAKEAGYKWRTQDCELGGPGLICVTNPIARATTTTTTSTTSTTTTTTTRE